MEVREAKLSEWRWNCDALLNIFASVGVRCGLGCVTDPFRATPRPLVRYGDIEQLAFKFKTACIRIMCVIFGCFRDPIAWRVVTWPAVWLVVTVGIVREMQNLGNNMIRHIR